MRRAEENTGSTPLAGRGRPPESNDRAALLLEVLEVTVELLGADKGIIHLDDERRGALEIVAQVGFREDSFEAFTLVCEEALACGLAPARTEGIVVEDVASDPRFADSHEMWRRCDCIAVQSTPIRDRGGKPLGILSTYLGRPHRPSEREVFLLEIFARQAERVIESKQVEEALRRSEAGLRLAIDAGQMGNWEWSIPTGEITWSGNLESIHGLAPGSFGGTVEAFRALIHPEDRERVLATARRSVESGADYEAEFRNLWPDGSVHWILGKGKVLTDEQGESARMIGVCTDITERKAVEEAAREADRRKDEFLAMISHELRNPLSAILNAVSLLDHAATADPVSSAARTVIRRQTEQLTRIVDELLDISQLTEGKLILDRRALDLGALVDRCVKALAGRRALEQHQHELRLEPALVAGDAARLEQILTNLLNNAIKYTPPGGRVTVEVQAEGHEAVLRVRDTGVGIAPELLPHVFDLFVQSDRGLDRRDSGLGVGLSVVRRLVEGHGGQVEARSPGLNRGSEFLVRLPLVAAAPKGSEEAHSAADAPVRLVVLVVDDNADAREALVTLLELAGHEVHQAEDGPKGLELALNLPLDAALIDIGLPGFDGFELARRVRQAGSDLRLIALTGYGDPRHRLRGAEVGFDAYLVKPVGLEVVLHELSRRPRRSASL